MSLHSLLTVLLLIPASPIACTRSSTRRVETPPTQASWITATSAFSDGLARLEERREVAALPQLRDAQLQAAKPRVQRPVAVAVAVGLPLAGPLVASGADQAFHVGLHQQLHHGLGHAAQEVAIAGFWPATRPAVVCRRSSGPLGSGEASQLHLSQPIRWPPPPTPSLPRIPTTSADATRETRKLHRPAGVHPVDAAEVDAREQRDEILPYTESLAAS